MSFAQESSDVSWWMANFLGGAADALVLTLELSITVEFVSALFVTVLLHHTVSEAHSPWRWDASEWALMELRVLLLILRGAFQTRLQGRGAFVA